MSIRRVKRPDRYTMISNEVFNSTLSFRAMGLLTYLLSKPDNWEVSVAHLVKISSLTARPDGRDSVYAILSELIEKRYVIRQISRNAGKMNGYDYDVFDEPQAIDSPFPSEPDTAEPDTATPYTAEPTVINTEIQLVPKVQSTDIAMTAKQPSDEDRKVDCRKIWDRYSNAYGARYATAPVRNAKVNKQVVELWKRLGAEAEHVAEYFVSINDAYLIRKCHDLGSLLVNAESYRTQWATGRQMNGRTARQMEDTQANINAAQEAARNILGQGERNAFL